LADENRKEARQVKFRVTDEEYARLKAMADDIGMSVPKFVKSRAIGTKTRHPKIPNEVAGKILSELGKIGVNVNQIARHINTHPDALKQNIDVFQRIVKGLGHIWRSLN